MAILLSVIFLLSMFSSAFQDERPKADEDVCYKKLEQTDDASAIQGGAVELWELTSGKKEADGDSFKKVALGWLSWQKVGLEVLSAVPVVGDAAGVTLAVIDRLQPHDVSTELECMQVLLDRLKAIETKLGLIHQDVAHVIDLIKVQTALQSYVLERQDLLNDQSALKIFADDEGTRVQVEHSCKSKSPRATRLNIRDLVVGSGLGFSPQFIRALLVTANCDEKIYADIVSTIITDMITLTGLDEACNKVLNLGKESSEKNYKAAAEDIKNVSLALLAGRFELQQECLAKFVKSDLKEYGCDQAKAMAKVLDEKFPLIKPRALIACGINKQSYYEKYEHHKCPDKLPSFCQENNYTITQTELANGPATTRQSVVYVPVPKDNFDAAREFIHLQAEAEADRRTKPGYHWCHGNTNVACWPCPASPTCYN